MRHAYVLVDTSHPEMIIGVFNSKKKGLAHFACLRRGIVEDIHCHDYGEEHHMSVRRNAPAMIRRTVYYLPRGGTYRLGHLYELRLERWRLGGR